MKMMVSQMPLIRRGCSSRPGTESSWARSPLAAGFLSKFLSYISAGVEVPPLSTGYCFGLMLGEL